MRVFLCAAVACHNGCNAVEETCVADGEASVPGTVAEDTSAQRPLHHNVEALGKLWDARKLTE